MAEFEYTQLTITLPDGSAVPNQLVRRGAGATRLGLFFPGLHYSNDMPLLYYTAHALLYRNTDVLQLRADYTAAPFRSLQGPERVRRISQDAEAIYQAGLKQRDYQQVVLVGKSIGTLGMAHLINTNPNLASSLAIWLTPLFYQPDLIEAISACKNNSLVVAGTGDSIYDPAAAERIQKEGGMELILIDSADHSLELDGDLFRSLQSVQDVMRAVDGFLDRLLK